MTASELIDALGGNAAVAEIAGVGSSAVSNWRRAGCIPPRLFLKFDAAGKLCGIDVPRAVFREYSSSEQAAD